MSTLLVVGAGKRVQADLIPVLRYLPRDLEILGIVSNREKAMVGLAGQVTTIASARLEPEVVRRASHIYVAVPPAQVRRVLKDLLWKGGEGSDCLIETPVLDAWELPEGFHSVSVAEDSIRLPWLPLVHEWMARRGGLRKIVFRQSAFQYHGVALAKEIASRGRGPRVTARLNLLSLGQRKSISLSDGSRVLLLGPRDYESGSFELRAQNGDRLNSAPGVPKGESLEIIRSSDGVLGFRLGEATSFLDSEELPLVPAVGASDSVVNQMVKLKRVGLFRLIKEWVDGATPYSTTDAINDVKASSRR